MPARTPVVIPSPARGADAAALNIVKEQHVSLAQAEIRLSWQRAVPSLNTALSRQLPGAAFGGIWIAPNDGDRVKVGVVGADRRIRATVMRAAGAAGLSTATDIIPVRYSATQVVAADAWLGTQLDKLARAGSGPFPLDVAYRMDLNRVVLGVAGRSLTAAEQALVKRAKARYGNLVQVVTQPSGTAVGTALMGCTYPSGAAGAYPFCDAPLRGGITIWTNATYQGAPARILHRRLHRDQQCHWTVLPIHSRHCPFYGGTGNWSTETSPRTAPAHGRHGARYAFGNGGDEADRQHQQPQRVDAPAGLG